jgi:hypothetical protein
VRVKIRFKGDAKSPIFACTIRQLDGLVVYNYTTHWAEQETPDFEANSIVEVEYPLKINLAAGIYHLGVDLAYNDLSRYYDRMDNALSFVVTGGNGARGVANLQARFEVVNVHKVQADIELTSIA